MELFNAWDGYRTRMLQFFADCDAVLCPADGHPAPPYRDRDPKRFDYTLPFSLLGWPVVTVRAGASKAGMPIGVQVAAKPWRDDVALALGMAVEQRVGGVEDAGVAVERFVARLHPPGMGWEILAGAEPGTIR